MRIDIMTLFPESLTDVLADSILGRAQERGYLTIEAHQIRDYTASKQNQVDDYPYGGGRGAGAYGLLVPLWAHVQAGGRHPVLQNGESDSGLRPLRGH